MFVLRLPGFASAEAAQARSRQLAREAGFESPSVHWFRWVNHGPAEWALELHPDEAGVLTPEERSRLIAIHQVPIQVHPTPVYRYMKEQYVDEFLSSGKLRLSSFEAFAKHPDEDMRDANEGFHTLAAAGRDSTMYLVSRHGGVCFVASASYRGPWVPSSLSQNRACLEIRNPLLFATAIAKALNDCNAAVVGACSYVHQRSTLLEVPGYNFNEAHQLGGLAVIQQEAEALLQYRPMFMKPARFQDEQEFRFVWRMDRPVPETMDIVCLDARAFCRKVDLVDHGMVRTLWTPVFMRIEKLLAALLAAIRRNR